MANNESTSAEGNLEHVFFRPWKGEGYGPQSKWGVPVMILGESHNCDEAGAKNQDFTINFVDWVVNDGGHIHF